MVQKCNFLGKIPYCLGAAGPLRAGKHVPSFAGKASVWQPLRRMESHISESHFHTPAFWAGSPFPLDHTARGCLGGEKQDGGSVRWDTNASVVSFTASALLPTHLPGKPAGTCLCSSPWGYPAAMQGAGGPLSEHDQRRAAEVRHEGETEARKEQRLKVAEIP